MQWHLALGRWQRRALGIGLQQQIYHLCITLTGRKVQGELVLFASNRGRVGRLLQEKVDQCHLVFTSRVVERNLPLGIGSGCRLWIL
jgi:hypothetical protein